MAVSQPDLASAAEDALGEEHLFAEINITPFTDVILVLLIIFMVSSSALVDAAQQGHLDVDLPQAGHAKTAGTEAQTLVVGVTKDEQLFVHQGVVTADALGDVLRETYARDPQTSVIVDADGSLPHHSVVKVLDQVRSAGFSTVGLGAAAER